MTAVFAKNPETFSRRRWSS